jgi:ATP-binding cassette subfamily C protein/ATP-binding cassette subfamily C protein LapB
VSSTRIGQIRGSVRQIDALMAMPGERSEDVISAPLENVQGAISFDQVTFRYGQDARPALANLSFEVAPGEVVAIVGANGAGKSSILTLIGGLYRPQGGAVRLDGRDLRQFDPVELRRVVADAPQVPSLFAGTIADNLRLAAPLATDADLEAALELAGGLDEVRKLPDGLATKIDGRSASSLPASLLGRLSLARAYVRRAPVLLLDEPVGGFDFEGEFAFVAALDELRGRSTIFVVTHRPSHMRLADKILILKDGAARYFGPPDKVIDLITQAYSDVPAK